MLNNQYFQSLLNFFAISSSPRPGQPDHMFDLYMSCRGSAAKQGYEKVYSETLFSPLDNMDREQLTEVTEKGYFPLKIGFLLEASEAELLGFQKNNPGFFITKIYRLDDPLSNSDQVKVALFLTSSFKKHMQDKEFTKQLEAWSFGFWQDMVQDRFKGSFNSVWEQHIRNRKLDHKLYVTQDVHTEILLNKGLLGLGKSNDLDYLQDHQIDLIREEIRNFLNEKLLRNNVGNGQKYDLDLMDKSIPVEELYKAIIKGLSVILDIEKDKYIGDQGGQNLDIYIRDFVRIRKMIINYEKLTTDHGSTATLASFDDIDWVNSYIIVPTPLNYRIDPIDPIIPYCKYIQLLEIDWRGSNYFSEQLAFHFNGPNYCYLGNKIFLEKEIAPPEHPFITKSYRLNFGGDPQILTHSLDLEQLSQQMSYSALTGLVFNLSASLWQDRHSIWCWLTPWIMKIESLLNTIKSKIKDLFQLIKSKIKDLLETVKFKTKGLFQLIESKIKGLFEKVKFKTKSLFKLIKPKKLIK